jgi:hypothetical protein
MYIEQANVNIGPMYKINFLVVSIGHNDLIAIAVRSGMSIGK